MRCPTTLTKPLASLLPTILPKCPRARELTNERICRGLARWTFRPCRDSPFLFRPHQPGGQEPELTRERNRSRKSGLWPEIHLSPNATGAHALSTLCRAKRTCCGAAAAMIDVAHGSTTGIMHRME